MLRSRLPLVLFCLLCAGFAVGFFVFPTYPNYDSYYGLLWGREVVDFQRPFFEGFRVPTQHPLLIAVGVVLSPLGGGADRVFVALILASFLWLVVGLYRLGEHAFTPLIGGLAALLLLTRFDFAFLAARGYIDVPYMALVVWATVLEMRRPRRGAPVLVLLGLAGLLRPEAWFMAAAYWAWVAWRAPWRDRAIYAGLAALAPLTWWGVDWIVTGDPLFSLHYTSSSAEDLGRSRPLGELPSALPVFLSSLVKAPVLAAALAGMALAVALAPRRAVEPLTLFLAGLVTFVLIGAAGASIIERYLVLCALALLVFAAVALGGFSLLERGRLRTAWAATSALLLVGGATYTALVVDLNRPRNELRFRGDAHAALVDVLRSDGVARGLRCGPLTLPNHKLVPDSRWILDLPADRVFARADRGQGTQPRPDAARGARQRRGVAVFAVSRMALFKHALTNPTDAAAVQVPKPGWRRVAVSGFYSAYVRC